MSKKKQDFLSFEGWQPNGGQGGYGRGVLEAVFTLVSPNPVKIGPYPENERHYTWRSVQGLTTPDVSGIWGPDDLALLQQAKREYAAAKNAHEKRTVQPA